MAKATSQQFASILTNHPPVLVALLGHGTVKVLLDRLTIHQTITTECLDKRRGEVYAMKMNNCIKYSLSHEPSSAQCTFRSLIASNVAILAGSITDNRDFDIWFAVTDVDSSRIWRDEMTTAKLHERILISRELMQASITKVNAHAIERKLRSHALIVSLERACRFAHITGPI